MAGRINDRELITLAVVFFLCAFSGAEAKGHHEVPTYFKRINHDGSLVDAANPQTRVKFLHPIQSDFSTGTTLEVNPSVVENGATVNVSWSGIKQPNETDFVAFYCPKDDPFDHYLDYFYVTESPSYVSGFGWWQVTVYNMRTSCEFRYYHKSYIHIATSNVLKFKGGIYAPLQGHLALTGDPTQMRVMWVSGTGNQFLFFIHVFTIFFFSNRENTEWHSDSVFSPQTVDKDEKQGKISHKIASRSAIPLRKSTDLFETHDDHLIVNVL